MKKNEHLNKWLWKWHFIAGLIALPFIVLLSLTGALYLFKDIYEKPLYQPIKEVVVQGNKISYQQQWEIANKNARKKPNVMILPVKENQATAFVSGRFSEKISLFINPYKGEVSGELRPKHTSMFKIRKLHGELLMGKYGTKIVELIASWMVVLILTGLYIWWPSKARRRRLKGMFLVRIKKGKRAFFRDLHAVTGFWIAVFLLLTLAGGFPWTDVFGGNFKRVQKLTHTGYPDTWDGHQLQSKITGAPLTLDEMVKIAKNLSLSGAVHIGLPLNKKSVFSVFNKSSDLSSQKMIHLDQYSGQQILKHNWQDVGILMRARMWVMAFHQGEFGPWNWWLMLLMSIALFVMSVSAIVSYLLRKRKDSWSVPKVPAKFKVGQGIIIMLVFLSILFPLFGISLIIMSMATYFKTRRTKRNAAQIVQNS